MAGQGLFFIHLADQNKGAPKYGGAESDTENDGDAQEHVDFDAGVEITHFRNDIHQHQGNTESNPYRISHGFGGVLRHIFTVEIVEIVEIVKSYFESNSIPRM